MKERIVLAYSGGLETSVAIPWIAERYAADVVTVTLDLGQGRELSHVRERALAAGALRAHVVDVRDELLRDFVLPALHSGAFRESATPLAAALGHLVVARRVVEMARMESAVAIAHGAADDGTGRARIESAIRALAPSAEIIAAVADAGFSRRDAMAYARESGISLPEPADRTYMTDVNLWGRSVRGGRLEDPWTEAPEDVFSLVRPPVGCPEEPASVDIDFERGIPVRANGIEMPLLELIESLDTIAGAHGVGRIDAVESTRGGKDRQVHEAPAAVLLQLAHQELERFVIPSDLEGLKRVLARAYAGLIHDGGWFSATRQAIDAFVAAIQPNVTGTVRLRLFKGDCRIVARTSPFAPRHRERPAAVVER